MKLNDITYNLINTIETNSLFKKGDTLIVAYSGGADSTALLHLLHSLKTYNLNLIAVHLNHCLRGEVSDEDELFCMETARQLGVTFESQRVDVKKLALTNKLNLENAGRQIRVTFFDEMKSKYNATAVVLAHHSDDQTETVLMRFLRGSGMTGLSGMGYCNKRGYIRPLLDISCKDLRSWLCERQIPWREDATNSDTRFLRNRIRHELIHILETYNPAIRQVINTTAEIIAADNILLHKEALSVYESLCTDSDLNLKDEANTNSDFTTKLVNGISCGISELLKYPKPMIQRVIRLMYQRVSGTLNNFGMVHCRDCIALCHSDASNSSISLPNAIVAYKQYNNLFFSKTVICQNLSGEITISGCGTYTLWNGMTITITEDLHMNAPIIQNCESIVVDSDAIPFPWRLRAHSPGDRIQLLGMVGHKKIKDLFIDLKIPRVIRSQIPLFFAQDQLFWVTGIRQSAMSSITSFTRNRIKISKI